MIAALALVGMAAFAGEDRGVGQDHCASGGLVTTRGGTTDCCAVCGRACPSIGFISWRASALGARPFSVSRRRRTP
jgi:hypothetical protein